jgi:hypothetical protein
VNTVVDTNPICLGDLQVRIVSINEAQTIGAAQPPPSSTQKVTPGCFAGAVAKNFLGDDAHAFWTTAVHVAAYAALKRLAPAALPGPGWVYVGAALAWDTVQITNSYADCKKKGGPSPE